jgi:hypothetical protein
MEEHFALHLQRGGEPSKKLFDLEDGGDMVTRIVGYLVSDIKGGT